MPTPKQVMKKQQIQAENKQPHWFLHPRYNIPVFGLHWEEMECRKFSSWEVIFQDFTDNPEIIVKCYIYVRWNDADDIRRVDENWICSYEMYEWYFLLNKVNYERWLKHKAEFDFHNSAIHKLPRI